MLSWTGRWDLGLKPSASVWLHDQIVAGSWFVVGSPGSITLDSPAIDQISTGANPEIPGTDTVTNYLDISSVGVRRSWISSHLETCLSVFGQFQERGCSAHSTHSELQMSAVSAQRNHRLMCKCVLLRLTPIQHRSACSTGHVAA